MAASMPPTQLRLDLDDSIDPRRLWVDLDGMALIVTSDTRDPDLSRWLSEHRVPCETRDVLGVRVPVRSLPALVAAAASCEAEIRHPAHLSPLIRVCENPPDSQAHLLVDMSGDAHLTWSSMGSPYTEPVRSDLVAALVSLDGVPVTADQEVWDLLADHPATQGHAIKARFDPDGLVEVTSNRPQAVESAPIRGLWRAGPGRWGVPYLYAADLEDAVWIGDRPPPAPRGLPLPGGLELSHHIRHGLEDVISSLLVTRGHVIAWESGLGRRLAALVALVAVDALPGVVVCPPHGLWAWRRHVDLAGFTWGLTHSRADVRLVTYRDLPHRRLESQGLILDSVFSAEAKAALPVLRRAAAGLDIVRVGVDSSIPDDPRLLLEALEVIRPAEFDSRIPIPERYPPDSMARFREHVESAVSRRANPGDGDGARFRASTVRVTPLDPRHLEEVSAFAERIRGSGDPEALASLLEMTTVGTADRVSAKLAAAAEAAGRREDAAVAVLTRHRRGAALLRGLLRHRQADVFDVPVTTGAPDPEPGRVTVVRFDDEMPDLRGFDLVVLCDYPPSSDLLERAVGPAGDPDGPDVLVLHAPGTADDRLAVMWVRRDEFPGIPPTKPLDHDEVEYLLSYES